MQIVQTASDVMYQMGIPKVALPLGFEECELNWTKQGKYTSHVSIERSGRRKYFGTAIHDYASLESLKAAVFPGIKARLVSREAYSPERLKRLDSEEIFHDVAQRRLGYAETQAGIRFVSLDEFLLKDNP